jgi:adenylyltransferase/sulfurtransferase
MQTTGTAVQSPNGAVELSNEEIAQYSRHLIMPEVALDGQKKLKAAKRDPSVP